MHCGVVIFDQNRPEGGWASIDGEQAFRVRGLGDLRSDILWWTSLKFADFNFSGLNRMANMRYADFLRTPMETLMSELGIIERFVPVNTAVPVLSEIFARTMTLAEQNYGLEYSSHPKFADDLRNLLLPPDQYISQEMDAALLQAYQAITKCTKNPGRVRTRSVHFNRNRYLHAMDVMGTPMPSGRFEYIASNKMPPMKDRLPWLLRESRPALIHANITRVDNKFSNVIAFGGGSAQRRQWLSHPELLMLAPFASMEISSVFLFEGYQPLTLRHPLPVVNPGFGMVSFSIGLLAENFWVGLASPHTSSKDYSRKVYSPRAIWMRASDRAYTMIPAMRLHDNGIQVSGYGVGAVTVDVPAGNLPDVIEMAGVAGLYPPLSVPEDALIQGDML